MKQYKAIFIDWDDTIGDFINAAHCSLQDMFTNHHLDAHFLDFQTFYNIYHTHNISLWERYGRDEVTKEYLSFDRFFYPLMMAPVPYSLADAIALAPVLGAEHLEHTTTYFRLLPDAEEVVRKLAERYPLTIVSNGFIEVQYRKVEKSGLRDCFRHIVLSEEVGAQKPNPKIYEEALRLNGCQPEEVLMIGDSWTSDIQGAINAGIDQLWVQSGIVKDPNLPATYKVARLRDVLPLLL